MDKSNIEVVTYERGVEEITEACGTGSAAAAVITSIVEEIESPINVKTKGGVLKTIFKADDEKVYEIYQEGKVKIVADGKLHL